MFSPNTSCVLSRESPNRGGLDDSQVLTFGPPAVRNARSSLSPRGKKISTAKANAAPVVEQLYSTLAMVSASLRTESTLESYVTHPAVEDGVETVRLCECNNLEEGEVVSPPSLTIYSGVAIERSRCINFEVSEFFGQCFTVDLFLRWNEQKWSLFVPSSQGSNELFRIWSRIGVLSDGKTTLGMWIIDCVSLRLKDGVVSAAKWDDETFTRKCLQLIADLARQGATRIQSSIRGFLARKNIRAMKEDAIKIVLAQSMARSRVKQRHEKFVQKKKAAAAERHRVNGHVGPSSMFAARTNGATGVRLQRSLAEQSQTSTELSKHAPDRPAPGLVPDARVGGGGGAGVGAGAGPGAVSARLSNPHHPVPMYIYGTQEVSLNQSMLAAAPAPGPGPHLVSPGRITAAVRTASASVGPEGGRDRTTSQDSSSSPAPPSSYRDSHASSRNNSNISSSANRGPNRNVRSSVGAEQQPPVVGSLQNWSTKLSRAFGGDEHDSDEHSESSGHGHHSPHPHAPTHPLPHSHHHSVHSAAPSPHTAAMSHSLSPNKREGLDSLRAELSRALNKVETIDGLLEVHLSSAAL